jgi:hypothetical protein
MKRAVVQGDLRIRFYLRQFFAKYSVDYTLIEIAKPALVLKILIIEVIIKYG